MPKKVVKKKKKTVEPAEEQVDVTAVILKMQKQLTFLEKKIDKLLDAKSSHSVNGNRFSKPGFSKRPSRHGGKPDAPFYQGDRSPRGNSFYGSNGNGEDRPFRGKKRPSFARKKRSY